MTRYGFSGARMKRHPSLDFFSDIATKGKAAWPIKFNSTDPKMPIINDPIRGASRKVIDMTIPESYGGGGTTLENPRGQLQAPSVLYPGANLWTSFSLFLPVGYPLPTEAWPSGWNMFFQVHGVATTGYPSFRLGFEGNDGTFGWRREPSKGGDVALNITPQYGQWMDFAIALNMSTDPAIGWVEVWTNFGSGWTQRPLTASAGDTLVGNRLYTETLTAGYVPGTYYASHLQNYRKAGMLDSTTCYHGDHRQVPMVSYSTEAAALTAGTFTALDPRSHA